MYKVVYNLAPVHLQDLLALCSYSLSSATRSICSLPSLIPAFLGTRTMTPYGDLAFSVIAPTLRNKLPTQSYPPTLKQHLHWTCLNHYLKPICFVNLIRLVIALRNICIKRSINVVTIIKAVSILATLATAMARTARLSVLKNSRRVP